MVNKKTWRREKPLGSQAHTPNKKRRSTQAVPYRAHHFHCVPNPICSLFPSSTLVTKQPPHVFIPLSGFFLNGAPSSSFLSLMTSLGGFMHTKAKVAIKVLPAPQFEVGGALNKDSLIDVKGGNYRGEQRISTFRPLRSHLLKQSILAWWVVSSCAWAGLLALFSPLSINLEWITTDSIIVQAKNAICSHLKPMESYSVYSFFIKSLVFVC